MNAIQTTYPIQYQTTLRFWLVATTLVLAFREPLALAALALVAVVAYACERIQEVRLFGFRPNGAFFAAQKIVKVLVSRISNAKVAEL